MKVKKIVYDPPYEKKFQKYKKKLSEKELENLREKFTIFKDDIFDSRLKTHKLKGNLKEYYACSITYSDRLVFKILDEETVYLIDIGDHDTVY